MSYQESWIITCDKCDNRFEELGTINEVSDMATKKGWNASKYLFRQLCPECKKFANSLKGGKQ